MDFIVQTTSRFEKDVRVLEKNIQRRIIEASFKLSDDPFGIFNKQSITKLKGYKNEYRLRVGDYRVRYETDAKKGTVSLLTVAHRRESYR